MAYAKDVQGCHGSCDWCLYTRTPLIKSSRGAAFNGTSDSGHCPAIPFRLAADLHPRVQKQFNLTPALYRRSPDWSASGIRPPLRLGEFHFPEHQFVTLPTMHLVGTTQSYTCSLEEISSFRNQMRIQFWREFLGNSPQLPAELYGLHETRPGSEKDDEQEVFYTTAVTPELANGHLQNAHPVTLDGGEYVMFTYEGPGNELQEFILTLYGTCMPMLDLKRRKGLDIERFFPQDEARNQGQPIELRCEYLIPVRR